MPRDRRKSSLGTRRGPPRQHIPFRADDLARGKKTGVAVAYVDRNSDEFEPFDQLIKQADNTSPPKRRRLAPPPPLGDDGDDDGEMSMDLAHSEPASPPPGTQGSPLAYFTNAYPPGSSTRPILSRPHARVSEIDYDDIPSPHSHLTRPSANRRASALSTSYTPREPTPDPDLDVTAALDLDFPQPEDTPSRSPEPTPEHPDEALVDKGKRRADPAVDDEPVDPNGVEEDIAQGLLDVEDAPDEDDPPPKKASKPRRPRAEKRVFQPVEHSPTPDGLRRGHRHRYKPLEWWRQEKVVYGRRDSDAILVPQIKEIIRIPQEPAKPLGKAGKRKRVLAGRAKSKGRDTPFNPEEGWDAETPTNATVIDYDTQEEVSRRVAFLASMIEPKQAANSNWFFQKIFGEGEFIAAGQMHIPPKSQKPSKSTKDNTYVFYVIQGAVSVYIHETSFVITTGGMFLVPRGNTYYIQNIAERDAKLFFTQARMLPTDDVMHVQHTQSAPPSSRRAISEDTSVGPKKGSRKA